MISVWGNQNLTRHPSRNLARFYLTGGPRHPGINPEHSKYCVEALIETLPSRSSADSLPVRLISRETSRWAIPHVNAPLS